MKVIYRFTDKENNKSRPSYFNKKDILIHFLKIFSNYDIYIIADNIEPDTYTFLCSLISSEKIIKTSLGNRDSFIYSVSYAIHKFKDDNEKIYLVEDDYIHTKDAPKIIEEGLEIAHYVSGYDHPDKYINHKDGGPNHFIEDGGEITRVVMTKSRHWKYTNSCCMTFATTIGILKQDFLVYDKYGINDYPLFIELGQLYGRKIVSCIPSVSTHCENEWLAKLVNWEVELKKL